MVTERTLIERVLELLYCVATILLEYFLGIIKKLMSSNARTDHYQQSSERNENT